MKKKRVLIIYATYGSGHKTVANYIYNYFNEKGKYEVKVMDIMDYGNIIGNISKKVFEQNFKHRSSLVFTTLYKIFDRKSTTVGYKSVTRALFHNKKLKEDIVSYNPDLIIASHFFGATIGGIYNKKGLINSKIISIITDFKSHELWIKDINYMDALIVSNDIVKKELVLNNGIDKRKIYSFGIPISESFSLTSDKEKIKNKYKVNNGKLTFLFFAGGSMGSSFTYEYLKKVLECRYDINIIFVCGKNERLKEKVNYLVLQEGYKNVMVLGFSNEVNNLLNICDVVITKPGGISVTECLEMKKPMLLIQGNGGQEIYNARFVCFNGYGINCRRPKKLVWAMNKIIHNRNVLDNMNNKLSKYDTNKSLEKLYKLSESLMR